MDECGVRGWRDARGYQGGVDGFRDQGFESCVVGEREGFHGNGVSEGVVGCGESEEGKEAELLGLFVIELRKVWSSYCIV